MIILLYSWLYKKTIMENYSKTISKVGFITIIGNVALSLLKIIVGAFANVSSLISDGLHSVSDVGSTIVVMIGAKISTKKPDKEHPYGHERFESISSILLGMILGATAILLVYHGVTSIIDFVNGRYPTTHDFIYLALASSIASIVVKFIMFLYSYIVAKKINSTSLKADSYHHLSDSLSSIGSLLGIAGIMIGGNWAILDPIATIIIGLFILKVAIDIAKISINEVVDKSAPEEFVKEITKIAINYKGVKEINDIKTRLFGNKLYVELEIAVDANISVKEGHDIAEGIHNLIEDKYNNIKHIMIHVNPYYNDKK